MFSNSGMSHIFGPFEIPSSFILVKEKNVFHLSLCVTMADYFSCVRIHGFYSFGQLLHHRPHCFLCWCDPKLSRVVFQDKPTSSRCLSHILMMRLVACLSSWISSWRKNKQYAARIKVSFEMLSSNRAEGTDSSSHLQLRKGAFCFLGCLMTWVRMESRQERECPILTCAMSFF